MTRGITERYACVLLRNSHEVCSISWSSGPFWAVLVVLTQPALSVLFTSNYSSSLPSDQLLSYLPPHTNPFHVLIFILHIGSASNIILLAVYIVAICLFSSCSSHPRARSIESLSSNTLQLISLYPTTPSSLFSDCRRRGRGAQNGCICCCGAVGKAIEVNATRTRYTRSQCGIGRGFRL